LSKGKLKEEDEMRFFSSRLSLSLFSRALWPPRRGKKTELEQEERNDSRGLQNKVRARVRRRRAKAETILSKVISCFLSFSYSVSPPLSRDS